MNRPIRSLDVQRRGSNVTGQFQSPKMDCSIQYESYGLDLPEVHRSGCSPDVALYLSQPYVLPVESRDSRGRTGTRDYHVDFLVLSQDGVEFVSCKGSSGQPQDDGT